MSPDPDQITLQSTNCWHQILIHHSHESSKEEIIEALFEIMEEEFFIPIAYRRGVEIDYFFVRNQREAMKKIFEHKLQLPVKGLSLQILVKLGVAKCREKQLNVIEKFNEVITQSIKTSFHLGNSQTLNLDNIAEHPSMRELCVNLGNFATLSFFMKLLNCFDRIKKHTNFRIFKFADNRIKNLSPFNELYSFQMEVIDLSNNNIRTIEELKHLSNLMVEEVYIDGNDCNNPQSIERIREILPKLKKIDRVLIASTVTLYKTNVKGEAIKVGNKMIPNASFIDGIIIKAANRKEFIKTFHQLRNDKCWTKVTIHHNDTFSMAQILKKIAMEICHNVLFFPCYAKRYKNRDEFFLYKNFEATKAIFQNELKVRMDTVVMFSCQLHMNTANFGEEEVDWAENIKYVINHRIQHNKLNLDNFVQEKLLSNIFICMGSSINLNFVLDQARRLTNQLTEISLENCEVSKCEGLNILMGFPRLKVLNLRNNRIEKIDGIRKGMTIKEVIMDGNPVCNRDPVTYVSYIHEYFPLMEYLDGHRVHQGNSVITFQNFLASKDIYTIVDEFVKYYFNIFDSFERSLLTQMYGPKSMLTICINYELDKLIETLPFEQIYMRVQKIVTNFDRNLKKLSDMSKASNRVFIGDGIAKVFNELSKTKHDLTSCNIDVPYFDVKKSKLIIIVSGLVHELTNDQPFLLAFTRTFTIVSKNSEFSITNDQIIFRNPTIMQRETKEKHSFVAAKYENLKENCRDLLPSEKEEKTLKLIMLQELTCCKKDYCLK